MSKKGNDVHFTFLKEEFRLKSQEIFGPHKEFARVLVCPKLNDHVRHGGSKYSKSEILAKAKDKKIFVIEIDRIIEELFTHVRNPAAWDYLRKDFILELLHFLDVYGYTKNKP